MLYYFITFCKFCQHPVVHPDGCCSINFISENLHSRISKSSTRYRRLTFSLYDVRIRISQT